MKKIHFIAIAVLLAFDLTSCGEAEPGNTGAGSAVSTERVDTVQTTLSDNIIRTTTVAESVSSDTNTSDIESSDIERSEDMDLLTPEELIELCDLKEEEYQGKDLEDVIKKYRLDREHYTLVDVHRILKNYTPIRNVDDIFSYSGSARTENFTSDAEFVVFSENIGTSIKTYFADSNEHKVWAQDGTYVFTNLYRYESSEMTDEQISALLTSAENLGVFGLESKSSDNADVLPEPISTVLIVKYKDGSMFKVSFYGDPEQVYPENYDQIRALFFP